jgi:hypothetical protein
MMRPPANSELSVRVLGGCWAIHQGELLIHADLPDAVTARWVLDLYTLDLPATDPRWNEVGGKRLLGHRDCVQNGNAASTCAGAVGYRVPLNPMGRRSALCEKHWRESTGRPAVKRSAHERSITSAR